MAEKVERLVQGPTDRDYRQTQNENQVWLPPKLGLFAHICLKTFPLSFWFLEAKTLSCSLS